MTICDDPPDLADRDDLQNAKLGFSEFIAKTIRLTVQ
jgi:hypothetical protein